jgi:hypothetical protein
MPLEDVARIALRETVSSPAPTNSTPTPTITRVRRTPRFKIPDASSATTSTAATMPATTAPAMANSANWRMKLTNGDSLHGALESWSDQHLLFRPDVAHDAQVQVAAALLDTLWHGSDADEAKARAMSTTRGDQDTALVCKDKDADIIAVRGAAVGIDGNELIFHYEDADRRINLAKIIGIIFADHSTSKADDIFHQVIHFTDGEQLSGHWTALANNVLTMETDQRKPANFALSALTAIDFRNGRLAYISDMTPSKVEQTPFFDEVIPYKTDTALGGGPLRLADKVYDKGLAVHSRCVLEYDLGGRFDRFKTMMGFESGAGALGDAVVRVLGDGKALYENNRAKGTDSPVAIDLDLTGISHLTLEVDFGEGQDVGDRVVWADARAVRTKVGG